MLIKSVFDHVSYVAVVGYVTVGGSSGGIFGRRPNLSVGTSPHSFYSEYIQGLRSVQRKETIAAWRQWRPQSKLSWNYSSTAEGSTGAAKGSTRAAEGAAKDTTNFGQTTERGARAAAKGYGRVQEATRRI